MKKVTESFDYLQYDDLQQLAPEDASLLVHAQQAVKHAYAPYSNFQVAAVVKLDNGETLTGTNQENASYPVGICAERTALSAASSVYPGWVSRRLQSVTATKTGRGAVLFRPAAFAGKHYGSTRCGRANRSVLSWGDKQVRCG
ncbi:hypothetical protein MKQ70_17360 [Chitinophaga sedimenti]|uniref:cytidine deaminase family protein n=1 Tax=Chitinophaga sedimenti TaxID=2033606 RepID=UPI0020060ED8|nr:hypothetical protein [Chitinophaga sedimenti]MCK7556690.1 hypothetical protein [Chitinophaga sedimenti]